MPLQKEDGIEDKSFDVTGTVRPPFGHILMSETGKYRQTIWDGKGETNVSQDVTEDVHGAGIWKGLRAEMYHGAGLWIGLRARKWNHPTSRSAIISRLTAVVH